MSARIITALEPWENHFGEGIGIFLAGGISNCLDWQSLAIERMKSNSSFTLINPRRPNFDMATDDINTVIQIGWEHQMLRQAMYVLFWFPKDTVCPITLFELGAALERFPTQVRIGTHPSYSRRFDVVEQARLQNPNLVVHDTLENTIDDLVKHIVDLHKL